MSWLDRLNGNIAQGGLTNSKWPESFIRGLYPPVISHGNGCHIYDTNHKKYIDFVCGLGANFFGYGNEIISREVMKHIFNGANHSFPTIHEIECAEMLKTFYPWVDRVKWTKTGSDACTAAIKLARAATGRDLILSEAYHGQGDDFISLTPPAKGIPKRDFIKALKDHEIDSTVAAVIIEPVITEYSSERIEYLKKLQNDCKKAGALLIFDEVITCLRFASHSVAGKFGIIPDLMTVGKAIGGGLSLAGVCGKKEIMDDKQVFISSTYAGETWPLIAGRVGMELLRKKSEYSIETLWRHGQSFMDKFNAFGGVQMAGYPTRGTFVGSAEERALFCQEMAKTGVLFHPATWFFNFKHVEIMDDVLMCVQIVKEQIKAGKCKLAYELPSTPFAAKARGQ